MKYLFQTLVILLFSFLGELLHALLPFPIPASIYGMILLFIALALKIVKLDHVRETGHFLVEIMPIMFVCPAVGLLGCIDVLRENWIAICVIVIVSLIVTFLVTGKVTELLMKKEGKHD